MTTSVTNLWFSTGNPFADAGAEMMAALASVDSPEELTLDDVRPLLPRLAKLYAQDDWRKDLNRVFPNAAMTNPAFRGKEEPVYRAKLEAWFGQLASEEGLGTTCLVSGREAQTYVDKSYLPLSGSVGGNFQSGAQRGWPVSAAVALSLQFAPLAMVRVGGMWALPHFSADELQAAWADERRRHVLSVEAVGKGGIEAAATKRRVNAFFRLTEDLVRDHRAAPDSTVALYLFNNHNQANHENAAEFHYMPNRVFRFIATAMSHTAAPQWRKVVRRGYRTRNTIEDEQEALQKYQNLVYQNLLNGASISKFFVDRRQASPVVSGEAGWRLFANYLKEVRGMEQARIDALRDLGDRIAPVLRDKKKRLRALEDAKWRGGLLAVLYRTAKDAMVRGADEPLITFEEVVDNIFAYETGEYSDWWEVKYLLLFRVYEQLFEDLKQDPDYPTEALDDEEEVEEATEVRAQ